MSNNQLMILQEHEKIFIPLEDIAIILIESRKVIITTPLLSALATHYITLLTCDDQFLPCGQWLSFSQHHRTFKILKAQLSLSKSTKNQLHKLIISKKVSNQDWVLKSIGLESKSLYLQKLSKLVQSGDKTHIEAQAASFYFKIVFGKNFTRQNANPINHYLNYGYIIIRSAISRSLVQYGLLPCLGIIHSNELNAFNLADDIIEPFKTYVDLFVIKLINENNIQKTLKI